ncbi:RNA-binding protein 40 [Amphibalanus amphitrite]|uniref:RNA-binding region-containing protein 3 n=1 Tax=Amphibalanus amphitrite TaxID=1232801 RepID=A0A6A4V753_AMPAM|nr:RNA-binding protein 40 [Amphibalanus amphitrite]
MTSSLVISNLPTVLTQQESQDLLKHFHASEVHVFKKCRKKKAIFARFPSVAAAQHALQELHQAKLAGSRLIVEYASDDMTLKGICSEDDAKSADAADTTPSCAERLSSFPFPSPLLRYSYPPPTADTLARICAALRSSPRFYTQVLHLMNKLSLPAPFASSVVRTPVPPAAAAAAEMPAPRDIPPPPPPSLPPASAETRDAEVQTEPGDSDSDSDESEWASDGEAATRPPAKRQRLERLPDTAKRLRAARLQRRSVAAATPTAPVTAHVPLSEVFEERVTVAPARKPVLRLPAETPAPQPATNGTAAEGGFAKLYPVRTAEAGDGSDREGEEGESEFITDRQLAENRLSAEDRKLLPVFARYTAGEVSARLYIKNLDKRVVAADLRRVFGRYIDWTDEEHKNAFDIRLMQEGRMKGQAFISLPSPAAAERALADTHGFILRDKPMVVQFARSARPRDTAS